MRTYVQVCLAVVLRFNRLMKNESATIKRESLYLPVSIGTVYDVIQLCSHILADLHPFRIHALMPIARVHVRLIK